MDNILSRSERKRRSKDLELLVRELVNLSQNDISRLPCEAFLQDEIAMAKTLKGGARKRQIKYIAKELRGTVHDQLFTFLEKYKGSRLKKNCEFRQLERMRDSIINDAITALEYMENEGSSQDTAWESPAVNSALDALPYLNESAIKISALRFAKTRSPVYSREVFRMLKAASEQMRFSGSVQI